MLTGAITLRVRYPETDPMGVVHHSHYFIWFEVGRTELMRQSDCAYADMEREGIRMPVVEASCRHHSPARYDDLLRVETKLVEVTRVTATFEYRVERAQDGRLIATGSTRHASTDASGAPRRMPERLAALVSTVP